jgi:hypothetical protein
MNLSVAGGRVAGASALSAAGIVRDRLRALGEDIRTYPEATLFEGEAPIQWQPIETAPTDGTVLWLRRPDRRRLAAGWKAKGSDPACWRDMVTGRAAPGGNEFTHWARASAEAVLRAEVHRLQSITFKQANELVQLQARLAAETARADASAAELLRYADARAFLCEAAENDRPAVKLAPGPLLKVRDALIRGDVEEAFHHLLILADPALRKSVDELWREWEAAHLQTPAEYPHRQPGPPARSPGPPTRPEPRNVAALGRPLSRIEERVLARALQPLGFMLRWDLRWYERLAVAALRNAVDRLAGAGLLCAWGTADWAVWRATPHGRELHEALAGKRAGAVAGAPSLRRTDA